VRIVSALILASVFLSGVSYAGECIRSNEFYLECLEGKRPGDSECQSTTSSFHCIGIPRKWHQRWGIALEKQRLFSMREVPYRDRLIEVAKKHLEDPYARSAAVDVLAFQGIQEVEDVDVFRELTKRRRFEYMLWYILASLQDPRTVTFAETRYLAIRGAADKLDAKSRNSLMEITDCLYHFPSDHSRAVLKRLADKETDEQLRQYIKDTSGI